jgi:hypothetical protein
MGLIPMKAVSGFYYQSQPLRNVPLCKMSKKEIKTTSPVAWEAA